MDSARTDARQDAPASGVGAARGDPLSVSPADRRALRLPWSALLRNKAHEFATKLRGRRIKGQGMIAADPAVVAAGFASLQGDDFLRYNLPQMWVERRQIPSAIHRRLPRLNATVLDLGCGPGASTEVLCLFADPSWTLLGFDLTPHFIDAARERARRGGFRNRSGQAIAPEFYCQNIADPLRRNGALLPDASADFAVSGGVVGLYMHEPEARRLAAELRRVIRPGGHVALDAGPSIPPRVLHRILTDAGFMYVSRAKSFWIEPRPKLVFRA